MICSLFTYDMFHVYLWNVPCLPMTCSMFTYDMFHVNLGYVPCLPVICSMFPCDMFHVYLWCEPMFTHDTFLVTCVMFHVHMWNVPCLPVICSRTSCEALVSRATMSLPAIWLQRADHFSEPLGKRISCSALLINFFPEEEWNKKLPSLKNVLSW